jgi:5-methylcytosine-specific restriction protein B
MPQFPTNIERQHVLQAIAEIDRDGVPPRGQSSGYDVIHEGRRYPPKLLVSIANRFANGVELDRGSFNGGAGTLAFSLLERLQFTIEKKTDTFEGGYQKLRNGFLTVLPGFSDFTRDQRYLDRERRYKDEILDVFSRLVKPAIQAKDGPAVGKQVLEVLTYPLKENEKQAQNIVGWRYVDPIRTLSDDRLAEFGVAVGSLLDEGSSLSSRVDSFVATLKKLAGPEVPSFPAMSRSMTSFLLTLSNPRQCFFIKTNEIRRSLQVFEPAFSWSKGGLNGAEMERIVALAERVLERLSDEGWNPKDLIDVQSFFWVSAVYPKESIAPDVQKTPTDVAEVAVTTPPLNQILYGPPGTGKTYHTVNKALEILDPKFLRTNSSDRSALNRRFRELRELGRIATVTFHQSFAYEDFVEGLRASPSASGQISYDVEDGVFKRICVAAAARSQSTGAGRQSIDMAGRRIWKMSLGNTLGEDSYVYDQCIEEGYILLGYGGGADFSGASTRDEVRRRHQAHGREFTEYSVTAVHQFVSGMKKGDLVIVSDGNHKFRAIGEVTGGYEHLSREDDWRQARRVKWLRVYSPSLPREQLMDKVFSQMTLYELGPASINHAKLASLLQDSSDPDSASTPWVLIIDEINRGNVANIFGELITLIEESKRMGAAEAMSVTLPYSKTDFGVPNNLYLIGTMNTADRSLVHMDAALRRRFEFEAMAPDLGVLAAHGIDEVSGIHVPSLLEAINSRIVLLYDRDHVLGHSLFLPLSRTPTLECLAGIFRKNVLPLLEEYFFEDWGKIRQVLGDDQKKDRSLCFITHAYSESEISALLAPDTAADYATRAFTRNDAALDTPRAYQLIYEREG